MALRVLHIYYYKVISDNQSSRITNLQCDDKTWCDMSEK